MPEIQFYELTHPEYLTDKSESDANPLRIYTELTIPAIVCSKCGIWAGSRRLCLHGQDKLLTVKLNKKVQKPLHEQYWIDFIRLTRSFLTLPEEFVLMPGDELGHATAQLLGETKEDIMHPFPGQIIVTERISKLLVDSNLTGYKLCPVKIELNSKYGYPQLFELIVTGSGFRKGSSKDTITHPSCENRNCVVQRIRFPNPEYLAVDQSTWDGSDFIHLDGNSNVIVVTKQVETLLRENKVSNYRCIPINDA